MNKFLNLKNGEISTNTYRFADAEVTTHEELVKAYNENSQECLCAIFDKDFFISHFNKINWNWKNNTHLTKKEVSEVIDELLGQAARELLLEWNDFCDDINELRADLEYQAMRLVLELDQADQHDQYHEEQYYSAVIAEDKEEELNRK